MLIYWLSVISYYESMILSHMFLVKHGIRIEKLGIKESGNKNTLKFFGYLTSIFYLGKRESCDIVSPL